MRRTSGARRDDLLAVLDRHRPADPREQRSISQARGLLRWLHAPFDAAADSAHVTASAIVFRDRQVLMHRHLRLGIWLQPGGHLATGEHPTDAALRETLEETGLVVAHPAAGPSLVHLDVHEGPRGHVHIDLRFLLEPRSTQLRPGRGESQDVAWFDLDDAHKLADPGLRAAFVTATAGRGTLW